MKKILSIVFILFAFYSMSFAGKLVPFMNFELTDSLLNKKECWSITKMWVAKNTSSKNASITYEDFESGKMIISGKYKAEANNTYCVKENLIVPYIDYVIVIICKDGYYKLDIVDLYYVIKMGYGDVYSLSSYMLQRAKNEMEEYVNLLEIYGDGSKVKIDDYLDNILEEKASSLDKEYNDINKKLEDAEVKKDDKSIKSKERKMYKNLYYQYRDELSELGGRSSVYSYINISCWQFIKSVRFDLCSSIINTTKQ